VTIAIVSVGVAALAGIAAIQGWLPATLTGDTAVTPALPPPPTPPESLSPGESVVGGKK